MSNLKENKGMEIICVGDSLTYGTDLYTPYDNTSEKKIDTTLPESIKKLYPNKLKR